MPVTRCFDVDGRTFTVAGVAPDDPYLNSITGAFEPNFQAFCRTFLPPDAVALDIGANIGVTALILGQRLRAGTVYAVEPGATTFALLEANLARNDMGNIRALRSAIADRSAPVRFLENSAFGHIDLGGDAAGAETTAALTLDDLVDHLGLDRLDVIKIDVEGFEPQVLKGATRTLARFKPLIHLEINSWCLLDHSRTNPIDFANDIFRDFRFVYRVRKMITDGTLLETIDSGRALIYDNIIRHYSHDDIVVGDDPRHDGLDRVPLVPATAAGA